MLCNMETVVNEEKSYEGLEIFLFSNGQENTPPRKYHLRHNDLQYWDDTLCFLARSQYGSLHSTIDLYTIDGVKVKDPNEISSGTAYVAVVPPYTFVDSGYNHYLVKASRSWEKRQMRKLSNQTDEGTNENEATNRELKSCRTQRQSLDTTANRAIRRTSIKKGSFSKQIVKKKPLTGQVSQPENSPILRKSNSNSYPPTPQLVSTKVAPIKRRQIAYQYSRIPKRIDNKLVTPENNKNTGQELVINKIPKIRKKNVDTDSTTKKFSVTKTYANNNPQKRQLKESSGLTPLREDSAVAVLSNLYKNALTENVSAFVDTNSAYPAKVEARGESVIAGTSLVVIKAGLSFQNQNSIDETNRTNNVTSEATSDISTQKTDSTEMACGIPQTAIAETLNSIDTTDWLTNFSYLNISVPNNQPPNEIKQNISLHDQSKDGQFVALTNQGDIVNLNVNVEIRNPEVVVQVKPNEESCKSRSIIDIKKQGVGYNETVTQSKSVQSLLIDYLPRLCCQDDQNQVYIQCACVDDSFCSNQKAFSPIRTCFVLLPVLTRTGKQCCKCDNNEDMKTPTKEVQTSADLQQPKVNEVGSAILIQTDQHGMCMNPVPATSQSEFALDCISKCQNDICSECGGKIMNVSKLSASGTTTLQTEVSQKTETVSFIQHKKPTRNLCDVDAQTDWCSTLLEARVNSDGHYTFHLPSIQKIKQYNYL